MSTQTPYPAPLCLLVITASNRENRFGPTVARWFLAHAGNDDRFRIDHLDLGETELPSRLTRMRPEVVEGVAERVAAADAAVVVTPEYNHSFPGPLKSAIDWFKKEWAAKPVGFVSYGGISGGLRAVEALRLVFAELHMVTLRDTVSFAFAAKKFDDEGQLTDDEIPNEAAGRLLDRLDWWGRALRRARKEEPYGK